EVDEAGAGKPSYRVLQRVGVEVADEQVVEVAGAGRIGSEPIDHHVHRSQARGAAVALQIAPVEVADVGTGAALALEVTDDDREALAGTSSERLRQSSAVVVVAEVWIEAVIEDGVLAGEGERLNVVQQPDGDLVATDAAGLHGGIALEP